MKKIFTGVALVISTSITAQTKKDTTITWYSVPSYDSVGNMIIAKRAFDHLPTKQDTIDFGGLRNINIKLSNEINTVRDKKEK